MNSLAASEKLANSSTHHEAGSRGHLQLPRLCKSTPTTPRLTFLRRAIFVECFMCNANVSLPQNYVAVSLWSLEGSGAKVGNLSLVAGPVIQSGYGPVALAPLTGWSKRAGAY